MPNQNSQSEWVTVIVCGDWTPNYVNVKLAQQEHDPNTVHTGRIHRDHPQFSEIVAGQTTRVRRGNPTSIQIL